MTRRDYGFVIWISCLLCAGCACLLGAQYVTAFTPQRADPPVLHAGHWITCDGEERVLEHRVLGRFRWEMHLGPEDEFGIYAAPLDGPDHQHDGPTNLLGPSFRVGDVMTWRGARQWRVPSLHLWISVVQAGAQDGPCRSYFIRIEERTS